MNKQSDKYEMVFELTTPVVTSVSGKLCPSTQVGYLVFKTGGRSQWDKSGVCFRTHGGTWFLSTLLGLDEYSNHAKGQRIDKLSIDFGQRWQIENMSEVIDEIVGHKAILFVEMMLSTWLGFFQDCIAARDTAFATALAKSPIVVVDSIDSTLDPATLTRAIAKTKKKTKTTKRAGVRS